MNSVLLGWEQRQRATRVKPLSQYLWILRAPKPQETWSEMRNSVYCTTKIKINSIQISKNNFNNLQFESYITLCKRKSWNNLRFGMSFVKFEQFYWGKAVLQLFLKLIKILKIRCWNSNTNTWEKKIDNKCREKLYYTQTFLYFVYLWFDLLLAWLVLPSKNKVKLTISKNS